MSLTPQITLTANLQDFTGSLDGGSSLIITLCGFGAALPRIAGTSMVAKAGPTKIVAAAGTISTKLWGNDVITPLGATYYSIAIEDDKHNTVQCGIYQFTGTETVDLSTVTPLSLAPIPPVPPVPTSQIYVTVTSSTTPAFLPTTSALVTYDFTLTANVTSSTATGFAAGTDVLFIFRQAAPGGYTFAWPSNVKNPPPVNPAAGSVTSAPFRVDAYGNFYPMSMGTWS